MLHEMSATTLPRSASHLGVKVWLILPKDDVSNFVIKARSNSKRMEGRIHPTPLSKYSKELIFRQPCRLIRTGWRPIAGLRPLQTQGEYCVGPHSFGAPNVRENLRHCSQTWITICSLFFWTSCCKACIVTLIMGQNEF